MSSTRLLPLSATLTVLPLLTLLSGCPSDDVVADGDGTSGSDGTGAPTTLNPTTAMTLTGADSTGDPTTGDPTTGDPTTGDPTTGDPTTGDPTTGDPTTGGSSSEGDSGSSSGGGSGSSSDGGSSSSSDGGSSSSSDGGSSSSSDTGSNGIGVYCAIGTPVAIPDNDALGLLFTINVPTAAAIADLDVTIDLTHTFLWDLNLQVTSPTGTLVLVFDNLLDDQGVGSLCGGDDMVDVTFDDASANPPLCAEPGPPSMTGDYQPLNPLSVFNAEEGSGDWTVLLRDQALDDSGTLNELCLVIEPV